MPTGIKLFSEKDNTLPTGIDCSLKNTRTLGVTLSFKCLAHTHFRYRLVQIWFPTNTLGKTELFSETKHKNTRRNTVFLNVRRTHTLWIPDGTNMVPTEGARKIESWGPGITRLGRRLSGRRVSRVPEIPRRTSTRWSSSPGVIPGIVSSGIPGGLQRNSRKFPVVYH